MRQSAALLLAALLLGLSACGGEVRGASARWTGFNPGPAPAELHRGEVVFNTFCMSCHGLHGRGEGLGPPLLDSVFVPNRLADDAVVAAVERGVPQKHYHFGAMPPVQRVTHADAVEVLGYVRWLQRRAGVADSQSTTSSEAQ